VRATFAEPQKLDLEKLDGGLVDSPNLARIPPDAAEALINVEFKRLGLERRQGRVLVGSNIPLSTHLTCQGGIFYELRALSAGQREIIVQDEYLYYNDGGLFHGGESGVEPATSVDIIGNNTEIGSFVQYKNKLFFADGGTVRRFYDGIALKLHDWGWQGGALPTPVDLGAVAGGSMNDGETYEVVYTYFSTALGTETNPSPVVSFTPAAPNLSRLIRAPADPNWTSDWNLIRFYRTFGDGSGEWFFDREVSAGAAHDTTNVDVTLSKGDDELGSPVAFDNDPPPRIRYLALYEEQIIAQDALDPTAIVWSKPGNPYAWPLTNKLHIERDAGSDIEAIFVMLGRLFVVKRRNGVFELTPNVEGGFNVELVTRGYGCLAYHSVVQAHDFAYWLDIKGFVRFDGQSVVNISDPKIRATFNRFKPYWESAAALDHPNKRVPSSVHDRQPDRDYVRWIAYDQPEDCVYHLIYDIPREAWLLHRPGPTTPTAAAGSRDRVFTPNAQDYYSGERFVHVHDDTGRLWNLNTTFLANTPVWSDAGEDYLFSWRSGWFGDGIESLLPLYVEVEYEKSASGRATIPFTLSFYRNADLADVYTQTFPLNDTGPGRRRRKMNLNAKVCERFAVGVTCDGKDADLKILKLRVYYQVDGERIAGI